MGEYKEGKLYIVDDLFPHPRSIDSWRGIEFHAYLDVFFEAKIFTTMSSIGMVGIMQKDEVMEDYRMKYPQYRTRVVCLQGGGGGGDSTFARSGSGLFYISK